MRSRLSFYSTVLSRDINIPWYYSQNFSLTIQTFLLSYFEKKDAYRSWSMIRSWNISAMCLENSHCKTLSDDSLSANRVAYSVAFYVS